MELVRKLFVGIRFGALSWAIVENFSRTCGASITFDSSTMGDSPFYCPPVVPSARSCVMEFQVHNRLYLDETFYPGTVNMLMILADFSSGMTFYNSDNTVIPMKMYFQVLLTLAEASRILVCAGRYAICYPEPELHRMTRQLCQLLHDSQELLPNMKHNDEPLCEHMLGRQDLYAPLRTISMMLQAFVVRILPDATARLGNGDARFDFEAFFKDVRELDKRVETASLPHGFGLTYPDLLSADQTCGHMQRNASNFDTVDVLDVTRALEQIASVVPLSHFVVNFGTADGECGYRRDWNADPANCLAIDGNSAILIEGDAKHFDGLRRKFENRTDVSLVLEYVSLERVPDLLREQLLILPPQVASASPDLLKMDIDHADCLFLEQAVRVVHPKLIQFEYATYFPPPLEYVQNYQPDVLDVSLNDKSGKYKKPIEKVGLEMAGCSLTAFLNRLPGYALVAAGQEDALVARRDLHAALGIGPPIDPLEAWLRGAHCHPTQTLLPGAFTWGFDFRVLADSNLSLDTRRQLISDLLESHGATQFTLSIPHSRQRGLHYL